MNKTIKRRKKYLTYKAASAVVQAAGITNIRDHQSRFKEFEGMPSAPFVQYDVWDNDEFFGKKREWPSYEEARELVRPYEFTDLKEYRGMHEAL